MRHFVVTVTVIGASVAVAAQTMYAVPDRASEIRHDVLQPGAYEQDSFFVAEPYPGISVLEHYGVVFSKWRICHGTDSWLSFPDQSGQEPQFIHQLVRHWASPLNDEVVTLVLRYTSPGLETRTAPVNDRQFVALARLRVPDAEKQLIQIGVKCEKGT
jgi:hypothetical protein